MTIIMPARFKKKRVMKVKKKTIRMMYAMTSSVTVRLSILSCW